MSSTTPDFKALARHDQIFLGAGLLAFIFTFIAFAHIDVGGLTSDTASAWHGVGSLAAILLLLAVAVGGAVVFAPDALSALPVPGRLVATGLSALALVLFVVRWLTLPHNILGSNFSYGLYWGGYVLLVLNIVTVVGGFLGMKANGVSLPGRGASGGSAAPSA